MVTFALPLPPAGTNHGYQIVRIGKQARLAVTPDVRAWKDALMLECALRRGRASRMVPQRTRPRDPIPVMDVALIWCLPGKVPHNGIDLDGTIKFTLDAIAKAWGFNDAGVDGLTVERVACGCASPTLSIAIAAWGRLPERRLLRRQAFFETMQCNPAEGEGDR